MNDWGERYKAIQESLKRSEYRRAHERARVSITMVSAPDLDDPADYFWVQIKSTQRLRKIMAQFQNEYCEYQDSFEEAPINFAPEHGPQLCIEESAIDAVLPGQYSWRGKCARDEIERAIDDFVFTLTGFHAQAFWANG